MKQSNQTYYKVVDVNNITNYVPVPAFERVERIASGLQSKFRNINIDYTLSRVDDKIYVRAGGVGSDTFVSLTEEGKSKKSSVNILTN